MGRLTEGKYNGEAYKTYEKVMNGKRSYIINKVYLNEKYGIYYYINRTGYMHLLKPVKRSDKEHTITQYAIEDYLLTKNNMVKYNGDYGKIYYNIDDIVNYIKELITK